MSSASSPSGFSVTSWGNEPVEIFSGDGNSATTETWQKWRCSYNNTLVALIALPPHVDSINALVVAVMGLDRHVDLVMPTMEDRP